MKRKITDLMTFYAGANLPPLFKSVLLILFLAFQFSVCNEVIESKSMRVTAIPNLRMREEPSITSKSIAFPKFGEMVESRGEVGEPETHDRVHGRWSKIIYKGQEGYVFGGFLKEVGGSKAQPTIKKIQGLKGQTTPSIVIWLVVGISVLVLIIFALLWWIKVSQKESKQNNKQKNKGKEEKQKVKSAATEPVYELSVKNLAEIQCPFCMTTVHPNAIICPNCHARKTTKADINKQKNIAGLMWVLAFFCLIAVIYGISQRGLIPIMCVLIGALGGIPAFIIALIATVNANSSTKSAEWTRSRYVNYD